MNKGWAAVDPNGEVVIATVSPTRRAAIVNFLVARKNLMVYSADTDEDIEVKWRDKQGKFDVVEVLVTPLSPL
jgi:hypothetical protein